jgi:hypothetical protein
MESIKQSKCGSNLEQSGFTTSTGTEKTIDGSTGHVHVDTVQNDFFAILSNQTNDFYGSWCRFPTSSGLDRITLIMTKGPYSKSETITDCIWKDGLGEERDLLI